MTESADSSIKKPSESLKKFLNTLPLGQRKSTAIILYRIRKELHDVIPNKGPVNSYLKELSDLGSIFTRLPLTVRQNLKTALLEALEENLNSSPFLLALCSTCLCLLELVAIRNNDRIDLEAQDVRNTIHHLNRCIIPNLTTKVLSLRTNMSRLEAWSLGLILFTYQSCIQCISSQMDFLESDGITMVALDYNSAVVSHTCMPVVISKLIQCQLKRRPYPTPPAPFKLFDLIFSCSVSTNYELISNAEAALPYDRTVSPLEASEPVPPELPRTTPAKVTSSDMNSVVVTDVTLTELERALETNHLDRIVSMLQNMLIISTKVTKLSPDSTSTWVGILRFTPQILAHFQRKMISRHSKGPTVTLYEEVHSILLRLWCRASEQRLLLSGLPQSYLWLAGLIYPNFECMSESGFLTSVVWLSRFLTAYQSLFRSTILASPHWYLQAIADVVVAVIDRLETAKASKIDRLEDTMCACLIAIGRPYSALGADESDARPELSRVIKMPLESILARMASCRSSYTEREPDVGTQSDTKHTPARPVLGPRIREILSNHLLVPMIKTMDPWALGQTLIGLRPATAKLLLKQLISEVQMSDDRWEGARVAERLKEVKQPVAVGGLHVAEKLAMKRKRR